MHILRVESSIACRLPVLADLNQALWLQNQDEHASGQPVVAALRRLPMDSSTATNYVLHAAPTENLPCDTRMRIGVAPCQDTAFWRSKAGIALIAVAGSLLLLVLCCVVARGCTSWRRRKDARFTPSPKHGVPHRAGGSRSTPPDLAKSNAPSGMSDSTTLGKQSGTKGSKWRGSPDKSDGKPTRARLVISAHEARLAEKSAPCGGDSSPSEPSWALTAEPSTVEPTASHIERAAAAAMLSADQQRDTLAGSHTLRDDSVSPASPSGSGSGTSALSTPHSSRSLSPVRTSSPRQARSGAVLGNQAVSVRQAGHSAAPQSGSAVSGAGASADTASRSVAANANAAASIAASPYLYLSASDASVRSSVLARSSALRASGAPPLSGDAAGAPAPAHPVWARRWTNVQASLLASAAHSADADAARDSIAVHNPAYDDAASAEQSSAAAATRVPAIANPAYSPHAVDSPATLRRTSPKMPFAAGRPTLPAMDESPDKDLKAIAHAILSRGHAPTLPGELLRASSIPKPLSPTQRAAVATSPARAQQRSGSQASPVREPAMSPNAQEARSPQRVRTTSHATPHGSPVLPVLQPQMCFAGAMPQPWAVDANAAMHAQRQQLMAKHSGFGSPSSMMQQMHYPVIAARRQAAAVGTPQMGTMTRRDGQRYQNAVRQQQQHARGQSHGHSNASRVQSAASHARAGQRSPVRIEQRTGSAQAGVSPVRRSSPSRQERAIGVPADATRQDSSARSHRTPPKRG